GEPAEPKPAQPRPEEPGQDEQDAKGNEPSAHGSDLVFEALETLPGSMQHLPPGSTAASASSADPLLPERFGDAEVTARRLSQAPEDPDGGRWLRRRR